MIKNLTISIFFVFFLHGCEFDDNSWKKGQNVSYSNSEMLVSLKKALEKNQIPFQIYEQNGRKYIFWKEKNDIKVQAIRREIEGDGPPDGRNIGGVQGTLEEIKSRFQEADILFKTTIYFGKEYVYWPKECDDFANEVWQQSSRAVKDIVKNSIYECNYKIKKSIQ